MKAQLVSTWSALTCSLEAMTSKLVLAKLLEALVQNAHRQRVALAVLGQMPELDDQAFAGAARADAGRILLLQHRHDLAHTVDGPRPRPRPLLRSLDSQIAGLIQAADQVLGDVVVLVGDSAVSASDRYSAMLVSEAASDTGS